jgi:hypothetical protein
MGFQRKHPLWWLYTWLLGELRHMIYYILAWGGDPAVLLAGLPCGASVSPCKQQSSCCREGKVQGLARILRVEKGVSRFSPRWNDPLLTHETLANSHKLWLILKVCLYSNRINWVINIDKKVVLAIL